MTMIRLHVALISDGSQSLDIAVSEECVLVCLGGRGDFVIRQITKIFTLCTVRDGSWGEWHAWISCSSSCYNSGESNKGTKLRTRTCNKPPVDGGKNCPGRNSESGSCDLPRCCKFRLLQPYQTPKFCYFCSLGPKNRLKPQNRLKS